VLVRTPVCAIAHCRVSVWNEFVVVGAEGSPGLLRTLLKDNYHEAAHQEGCVRLLVIVQACVMVDLVVFVLLIVHEFF